MSDTFTLGILLPASAGSNIQISGGRNGVRRSGPGRRPYCLAPALLVPIGCARDRGHRRRKRWKPARAAQPVRPI